MGLKGLLNPKDDPSDAESEREALRRQRLEAAAELETMKRALSERVAQVQLREQELADALARVERREQKLDAAGDRGSRLDSVRLRLAEAKEARTALDARRAELDAREQALAAREAALHAPVGESVVSTQSPPPSAAPDESGARGQELDAREAELREREDALAAREGELDARERAVGKRVSELDERERELERERESVVSTQTPDGPVPVDGLAEVEAKLAELRLAEQAFVRTHHELAARSDAIAEQEAALAKRERALALKELPAGAPEIAALDARIRRLEQGGRPRAPEPQTFSAGLRALQERGLRGNRPPEEPLH